MTKQNFAIKLSEFTISCHHVLKVFPIPKLDLDIFLQWESFNHWCRNFGEIKQLDVFLLYYVVKII